MTQETAVEISDEVVELAWSTLTAVLDGKHDGQEYAYGDPMPMRIALQATIPLVVERLVGPLRTPMNKTLAAEYFASGSNHRRQYILAKVKK